MHDFYYSVDMIQYTQCEEKVKKVEDQGLNHEKALHFLVTATIIKIYFVKGKWLVHNIFNNNSNKEQKEIAIDNA